MQLAKAEVPCSVQEQKETKVDAKIDMNHNVDVSSSLN